MRKLFGLLIPLLLLIVIIYPFALFFEYVISEKQIEITVTRIEKVVTEEQKTIYYVYTTTENFINADNTFHKKDNADELIKKFKIGRIYKVDVVGYKFGIKLPYFFKERNIIDIVEDDNILKKFGKY